MQAAHLILPPGRGVIQGMAPFWLLCSSRIPTGWRGNKKSEDFSPSLPFSISTRIEAKKCGTLLSTLKQGLEEVEQLVLEDFPHPLEANWSSSPSRTWGSSSPWSSSPWSSSPSHHHHGHHHCVQEDSHPLKVESLKLFDGTAWLEGGWDPGPPWWS